MKVSVEGRGYRLVLNTRGRGGRFFGSLLQLRDEEVRSTTEVSPFFPNALRFMRGGGGGGEEEGADDSATTYTASSEQGSTTRASSTTTSVLRIRLPTGAMERVAVTDLDQLTLRELVQPFLPGTNAAVADDQNNHNSISYSVQLSSSSSNGSSKTTFLLSDDAACAKSLRDLGLQHGSLVTVLKILRGGPSPSSENNMEPPPAPPSKRRRANRTTKFDPFPTLAKHEDYARAAQQLGRGSTGRGSYTAIARWQEALHTVEPQAQGKLVRLYMCANAAARVQASTSGPSQRVENRCALLFGTVVRERSPTKASRTSLSSTTEADQYGMVARVQAVWEPPAQQGTAQSYDRQCLLVDNNNNNNNNNDPDTVPESVRRVAEWLELVPVGWIFTYSDGETSDRTAEDSLPVLAPDVYTGAQLQIANMKRCRQHKLSSSSSSSSSHINNGARFVTLAMDARTGATEAFQLSDVAVQMVAEGMLLVNDGAAAAAKSNPSTKSKSSTTSTLGRYCPTKHPILVDGKETTELDTVLCLVNTALLSHNGLYSAVTATTKKKTGRLTKKALKNLAKALGQSQSSHDDSSLLALLCDFATLVALYELIDDVEISRALVTAVRQYTKGHKRTTTLDVTVKQRLQRLLLLDQ